MALVRPISPSQTDARSVIDDNLADSIRENLDELDTRTSANIGSFFFHVEGPISSVPSLLGKKWDKTFSVPTFTPSNCTGILKKSGLTGSLKFDIRKVSRPRVAIIGIDHQFESDIQAIGRIASAISTQSIQRSATQISTQSITYAKSTLNIQSILGLGGTSFRVNFTGDALDADYVVGKYIKIGGATNSDNNGTFIITDINTDGFPCIVYTNALGVEQLTATGTVNLQLFSYNYSNPVVADFNAGEIATFASHTDAANDGGIAIYKTNQAGNNIWAYNEDGLAQAGVAGNANANRWTYAYSSTVSSTHYAVNDKALMASHTDSANNDNLLIIELNRAGSNIIVYNPSGVAQGGSAGNASSNLWVVDINTDPAANTAINESISIVAATNPANVGTFVVRYVNLTATDLTVYNEAGVAQAGVAGNVWHTKKLVKFATDQAATIKAGDYIEIEGAVENTGYKNFFNASIKVAPHLVLSINRGGGANYNAVINPTPLTTTHPKQGAPSGHVMVSMESIFSAQPAIVSTKTGSEADQMAQVTSTAFVGGSIAANTPLSLFITEVPTGEPEDLTIILA